MLFDGCRRRPETALALAWAAGVPVAVIWVVLAGLDGRANHLAPVLVAAAPAIAARLLGLSSVCGGVVALSLVLAGVGTALAAWGILELAGLVPAPALLPGLPAGVRGEAAVGTALGALAGAYAATWSRVNR